VSENLTEDLSSTGLYGDYNPKGNRKKGDYSRKEGINLNNTTFGLLFASMGMKKPKTEIQEATKR
jgi:hypothetical protein